MQDKISMSDFALPGELGFLQELAGFPLSPAASASNDAQLSGLYISSCLNGTCISLLSSYLFLSFSHFTRVLEISQARTSIWTTATMSFIDYSNSSYRKMFGEAPRHSGRISVSSSPSRLSSGYRSGAHRTYGSPSSMLSSSYRSKLGSGRNLQEPIDLTQSTAVTNELKIIRTNEKEQLQGLNDRFVSFIDKVHNLEQHNKVLEAEVALLRQRHNEPSRLHDLYEQEIRELRARVEELTHEKSQMHLDCVQMNEALDRVKEKLDEETKLREEAENTLKTYRKDVDDATLVRLELEKKVESLLDEIAFLRKVHEEELQEMQASMQATQVRNFL